MNHNILILVAAAALVGCPKSEPEKAAPTATVPATIAPSVTASAPPAVDASQPTAELKISASGSTMSFDVTKFEVKVGQPVHVVLENKPPGELPHNWVLLSKAGKEASYAASVVALEKDGYYKEADEVIAHVDMVKPGKTAETTFIAPKTPGDYPYICSFPGHYMMMKGVLTVKAP
jgi:azurin